MIEINFQYFSWIEDFIKTEINGVLQKGEQIDPEKHYWILGQYFVLAEITFGSNNQVKLFDVQFATLNEQIHPSGAYGWEKAIIDDIFYPKQQDLPFFGGLENCAYLTYKGLLYRNLRKLQNTHKIECEKTKGEEVRFLMPDGKLLEVEGE